MVGAMLGEHTHGADIASGRHQTRKRRAKEESAPSAPVLEVSGLAVPGLLHDITFELNRGEVLGIAGLVGSGRTELLRAVAGLDPRATGGLRSAFGGGDRVPVHAVEARKRGISLLPEDRKGQGLLLPQSATENIVLGEWRHASKSLFINETRLMNRAAAAAGPVGFDVRRMRESAGHLSGGNQQKLMIARWLYTDYPILLADEPTRGVDVGAKSDILEVLESIVDEGRSMIVVSSELEEVIGLSDRVLVLHEGRIVAALDSAEQEITPERILQLIFETADSGAESGDAHHE
ncbi:ATP-binding cassette domain-containing protein [Leucobacter weissii]|nr:ATP-binding cassette domain-containing protein [Leucobacter weissii]